MRCQVVACWLHLSLLLWMMLGGLITASLDIQLLPNCTDSDCLYNVRPTLDDKDILERHANLRKINIEAAKERILEHLGLSGNPHIAIDMSTPVGEKAVQKATERIKERHRYSSYADYYHDVNQIILFSEEAPPPEPTAEDEDDDRLKFTIEPPTPGSSSQVLNAYMFVLVRYKRKGEHKNPSRRVMITLNNIGEDGQSPPKLVTSLTVWVRHTSWHMLTMPTSVIQDVVNSRSHALQFSITCTGCVDGLEPVLVHKPISNKRRKRIRMRKRSHKAQKRLHKRRPFLIVHTRTPSSTTVRGKRDTACTTRGPSPCNKRTLYVTFAEMGLADWILSPTGYYANYCEGHCSSPAYWHQEVETGEQCCQATGSSGLTLVYLNERQEVEQKHISDMTVEECACS